jgi:hypothetical protein
MRNACPASAKYAIKGDEELAESVREGERKRSEQEQSWIAFIEDLRANPEQLRRLNPTTATNVDGRMYSLWQLLNQATPSNSRYAIDSVEPIQELVGEEVAAAFAAGLPEIWRAWKPTLRSARPHSERNIVSTIDCLGLTGISIEAAGQSDWAQHLTEQQAIRAAEYATLELNGFPEWIAGLVLGWPSAVKDVLVREVASNLDESTPEGHYTILDAISRGDESLVRLMSPALMRELNARPDLSRAALRPLLFIPKAWPVRRLEAGALRASARQIPVVFGTAGQCAIPWRCICDQCARCDGQPEGEARCDGRSGEKSAC